MSNKKYSKIDNIWITSKTRINAESRYRSYSLWSHLLFSYYAFLLIVTSVFSASLSSKLFYFSELNICISVALFASSLIIYGFRFEELAGKHRDCYLRLDSLLSEVIDNDKKLEKYSEILAGYPNHTSHDYDSILMDQIFWKKRELWNSQGKISLNWKVIIKYYLRWAFYRILILLGFLIPAFMLIKPFWN